MSTKYSLTVKNNATDTGNFCVYQTNGNQNEDIHSLVWFSKSAHPGSEVKINWNINYAIAWSETGVLKPGVIFQSDEAKPIDLAVPAKTASALSVDGDRLCYKQTDHTVPAGEIGLLTDKTVPEKSYSIGIQISGAPAFAAQVEPNYNMNFSPHPRYWVASGNFEAGEVIDIDKMVDAVPLELSDEVPNCAVTLMPDGTIK